MNDLEDVTSMHNLLLRFKPSEASHDASLCPLCVVAEDGSVAHVDAPLGGGDMSNKTYTEEEVLAQLEPLKAELAELKASQDQAAVDTRINDLTVEHESAVAEIQAKLDAAAAEAEAFKQQHEDLVAYLKEEGDRAETEAALVARRDEIKAQVADVFADEHIQENLDRWASMDAEAFEQMLSDYQAAAAAALASASAGSGTPAIASTVMTASVETAEASDGMEAARQLILRNPTITRHVGATHR